MRRNVAGQVIGAQMVSAADGTPFTGSVTVYVTLDGGTQAVGTVGSGAATHEGNGYHTYAPAQAETNGALAAYTFVGTGAVPATVQVFTVGYDPGVAVLPANVTQFGGTNGTFASGRPEVNTTHVSGTAQTARNLGASVLLSPGTGTGQVLLSSGAVTAGTVNDKTGYGLADGAITTAKVADGALTAAKFAAGAFDAVWSVTTRTLSGFGSLVSDVATAVWAATTRVLTAGTNIELAKGTGVTGFNDVSSSDVQSAAAAALTAASPLGVNVESVDSAVLDLLAKEATVDAVLDRLVDMVVSTGEVVADGGNTATAFETDLTEAADGHWADAYLLMTSGDLAGQVKRITAYDGTTKVVTVAGAGFTAAPEAGDTFALINR